MMGLQHVRADSMKDPHWQANSFSTRQADHFRGALVGFLTVRRLGGEGAAQLGNRLVSFVRVRSLVPGGIRSQKLGAPFPFSLLARRAFPFPLCERFFPFLFFPYAIGVIQK